LRPSDLEAERQATPGFPADPAWDEAFLRVESYIRAHGLESSVLLNRVTADIIREALARAAGAPGAEPVAEAMQVANERIGAWFAHTGRKIDWSNERTRAQCRLALILADLPGHWANYFLSPDPIPPELVAAMDEFRVLPGPELSFSKMPPAPIEFGLLESNDRGSADWARRLPGRVIFSWLLIVGFLGAAWAASH